MYMPDWMHRIFGSMIIVVYLQDFMLNVAGVKTVVVNSAPFIFLSLLFLLVGVCLGLSFARQWVTFFDSCKTSSGETTRS